MSHGLTMPQDINTSKKQALTQAKWTVALGFATQGLGYATVMTALPAIKSRFKLSDDQLSIIILAVCISAACGSLLVDRLAVKFGSRIAITFGFLLEACGIFIATFSHQLYTMVLGFVIYGLGLGCIDAALNMQAVIIEQKIGRSILGGFFACYTTAAFSGAMLMSATVSTTLGATAALITAATITIFIALFSFKYLLRIKQAITIATTTHIKTALPTKGIFAYGMIILIAFTVDSAISTWSTIYLKDILASSAALAPLGYAAYQMGILLTRLSADRILRVKSAVSWAVTTTLIGVIGCLIAGISQHLLWVIIGFALSGVAVGALVPLTFSAAGKLDSNRRDEILARVNIFNYGGAILGAVLVGLLSSPIGYGPAFVILGIGLLCILFFKSYFKS